MFDTILQVTDVRMDRAVPELIFLVISQGPRIKPAVKGKSRKIWHKQQICMAVLFLNFCL